MTAVIESPVTTGAVPTAIVRELPATTLIVALYASDYAPELRPDPAKVATFMVEGVNRWGLTKVIDRTVNLRLFWEHCDRRTNTNQVWAEHLRRFDNVRVIHCSFIVQEQIMRIRAALAAEAVSL